MTGVSQHPASVLVVDDHDANRFAKTTWLRRAGFSTFEASTGRSALEALSRHPVDVVLLDINLPDMSGTDILAQIKNNQHLRRSPVVVLTTTDDKVEIQRCYDLGCNVYITKPVNYDSFATAIRQLGLFLSVIQVPSAT